MGLYNSKEKAHNPELVFSTLGDELSFVMIEWMLWMESCFGQKWNSEVNLSRIEKLIIFWNYNQ